MPWLSTPLLPFCTHSVPSRSGFKTSLYVPFAQADSISCLVHTTYPVWFTAAARAMASKPAEYVGLQRRQLSFIDQIIPRQDPPPHVSTRAVCAFSACGRCPRSCCLALAGTAPVETAYVSFSRRLNAHMKLTQRSPPMIRIATTAMAASAPVDSAMGQEVEKGSGEFNMFSRPLACVSLESYPVR